MTAACSVCSQPIDLSQRHVAISRAIESERRGAVTVHEAEVTARMHIECAERGEDKQGRSSERVATGQAD